MSSGIIYTIQMEIKNMIKALNKDNWVLCGNCKHKLCRLLGKMPTEALEIKCHSCKELNIIVEGKNIDEYITSKNGEKHCDT